MRGSLITQAPRSHRRLASRGVRNIPAGELVSIKQKLESQNEVNQQHEFRRVLKSVSLIMPGFGYADGSLMAVRTARSSVLAGQKQVVTEGSTP